ncbi:MAG: T9SS type A sorting domain-containing protein [Candidatus Delongbacteria bacterium]|jgi:hypothetical protein|nr:T9SS type A sorting domain-containing protein [Candidatus Delongbacteria bacterium]
MKKLIIISIILIQMVLSSQFSGGSGTVLDPYHVATAEDLDNIRNYLESSFIQTADIDLGVAPWNVGEGWDFADIWVEDVEFHNDGYPFLGWHDTEIIDNGQFTIDNYELEQNYPNPFNNETNISYTIQDKCKVEISVYNGNGQFVQSLVNGVVNAGMHSTIFKADNLNSGIYYYQLKIDGMVKETKKMLYLK